MIKKGFTAFRYWMPGLCLVMWLSFCSTALAASNYTLKFATLAPTGSTWMNLMEEWAEEVKTQSDGRLTFKFYPGGVQGDEPDVLKKMRFGQIHGSALTGYGIGNIYSPARVLEVPFLLHEHGEIDFVRNHFMPEIETGFRKGGYELLGWMEVGFVHFFSQKPVNSMDDLRKRRIWLWQGDPLGEALFEAGGMAPIPLSIIDVFTSLSTGLIDTVYCTPLAAIALQWFTKTSYITQVPMANAIGALVVSNRFFNKLPSDLQKILRETGKEAGEKLIQATRTDNTKSLEVLREKGLKFVFGKDSVEMDELLEIRDKAAATLGASGYIPTEVYDRTRALLKEYRASHAVGSVSLGGTESATLP